MSKLKSESVIQFKKAEIVRFLEENPDAKLEDIFQFIPKTTIAIESRINKARMTSKAENPNLFRFQEIRAISKYLGIPVERFTKLLLSSLHEEKE